MFTDMSLLSHETMQRELNKRPGRVKMMVIPIVVIGIFTLFYVVGVNLFNSLGRINVKERFDRMNKLLVKTKLAKDKFMRNAKRVIKNTEGDQITGWLIVILIVVVVGAFFMKNYQDAIVEVWDGVIAKIKSAFGI